MPAIAQKNNLLVYKGSNFLKQRLILSTLSGKPVRIIEIRSLEDEPGLREYEISLIRLIDRVTNGTTVELNETGTSLYFSPGLLHGGNIEHECSLQRSLGYYLEVLLCLGPFCKKPINATLHGVSSNSIDPSVDHFKASALPALRQFILVDDDDNELEFKIAKRGMCPLGGGQVTFKCPVRKQLRPVQISDSGMIKRIRGTVYALRVSPATANRMVDTAKGVLLKFIPDVYINTDQCRGKQSGKSPGFGIHLVAETTKGVFYSAEQVSNVVSEGQDPSVPEDLGIACAHKLLDEIYRGGCIDSTYQSVAILFMALGPKDVSKYVTGPLSEYTINFLRHLKEFFGITFKVEHAQSENEDDIVAGSGKINLMCVGIGYSNINKRCL